MYRNSRKILVGKNKSKNMHTLYAPSFTDKSI